MEAALPPTPGRIPIKVPIALERRRFMVWPLNTLKEEFFLGILLHLELGPLHALSASWNIWAIANRPMITGRRAKPSRAWCPERPEPYAAGCCRRTF